MKFQLSKDSVMAIEDRLGKTVEQIQQSSLVEKPAYVKNGKMIDRPKGHFPRDPVCFQFGRLFSVRQAERIIAEF